MPQFLSRNLFIQQPPKIFERLQKEDLFAMRFIIDLSKIKLLIFDCDGTLVDTMPIHYDAWNHAYLEQGKKFYSKETFFLELAGMDSINTVITTNKKFNYAITPSEIIPRKEALFDAYALQAKPIETVVQIAKDYHHKLPMVVASGGNFATVNVTLKNAGIHHLFKKIITAESVTKCKPDPDIFLEAAKQMGIKNYSHCLVFEDSLHGLEAAKRAGMNYVDIHTLDKNKIINQHWSWTKTA